MLDAEAGCIDRGVNFPVGQSLVLVAVTGWGQEADKAAATEAGFDMHIVKPLDPSQLGPIFELIAQRRERVRT